MPTYLTKPAQLESERRNVENLGVQGAIQTSVLNVCHLPVPFDTLIFDACPVACEQVLACVRLSDSRTLDQLVFDE